MRIAVVGGTGMLGRAVVEAAAKAGHETVVLARSTGVDVTNLAQVVESLEGVDAVVDAASIRTQSAKASTQFFTAATHALLEAERVHGVDHHVAISIIGAAEANAGYYAGKAAQEALLRSQPGGWTVLRAAQFHEFGMQIAERFGVGNTRLIPSMLSQPVAVREVGERLVELAEGEPQGFAPDLAGPHVERLSDMVRRYFSATRDTKRVVEFPLPGRLGRCMRNGTLLAGPDAQLGKQTYNEWLAAQR